jgi:hypothetical protein
MLLKLQRRRKCQCLSSREFVRMLSCPAFALPNILPASIFATLMRACCSLRRSA